MSRLLVLLAAAVLFAGPLAGCLKGEEPVATSDVEQQKADDLLGQQGRDKLVEAASIIPKNFSVPSQKLLPPVEVQFTGSVSGGPVGGYEAERDEGGISYNTRFDMFDIAPHLPPGQPAEIVIDLYWDGSEANSGDLDIVVDVPGNKTSYSTVSETWNWNYVLKTAVVNTVGVAGMPAQIGVQIASAVASQGFDYRLDVRINYAQDVLTPYHAWSLQVPNEATALIFESEKAGGDEHIQAEFVLVDPDDQLVQFVQFDDIKVPTESILIPITKGGEYVFYAYYMHGGFLRAKADVPLDTPQMEPLALVETETVDSSSPQPGYAGKDWAGLGADSPTRADVNPTVVDFSPGETFPLLVKGFIRGPATPGAKVVLKSPVGVFHELTRYAYYEDERGSLGYTAQHGSGSYEQTPNNAFTYANIAQGAWSASIVNDGAGVEIGHVVVTYQR